MALILNSSGLVVQVEESVPTVPAGTWGNPFWVKGTVGDARVSSRLGRSVVMDSGAGRFSLEGLVLGVRGSILVTFIAGVAGATRTLGYLTDSVTTPTKRIVLRVDGLNRPGLSIHNYAGTQVATVNPTYGSINAGAQVQALMSWDSTVAIDSTRFAVFQVNRSAVPNGDWVVNPIAAWTSFQPTHLVLGAGVGGDSDFNGQIISLQISNDTVAGGSGSSGQFPASHVFDCILSDVGVIPDTVTILKTP